LKKKSRFSEEMILECLHIMESGDIEDLFEIIPRIGVLRDARFYRPLLDLLNHKDAKKREFAAYSMGAMREPQFLEPLKKAFRAAQSMKGSAGENLLVAVIEAIGAIGDDAAVEFFLPMLKAPRQEHKSRKMPHWIVESLGAIAQQGGARSLDALLELTWHQDSEIQAQALSELSVAYWHRPNEMPVATLERICALTHERNSAVAESALEALQSLADVGCRRAESLFSNESS
jgi:HEAT repeat protein